MRMNNRFRVSSTLPRKLEELGISPDTVLRQAGLPTGLFKLERILVSTEEFFALYRGTAEASNDPAIGLKLGTEERVERYDPIKLAALSARSFRDAIERSARYKQLTCPEKIRLLERGDECAIKFVCLLAHEEEPPCSSTCASHGFLRWDSEVLDNRCVRRESSFNALSRIAKCMRHISAAQ
jgi:Arabinose-binding domain of AraC transcription regulator, N-term